MKTSKQTIETMVFRINVTERHIQEGECREPSRCMEKVAIQEALDKTLGEDLVERLRLDGAQVKFNYDGYRWYSTTPKSAKVNLIRFDHKQPVMPHSFVLKAIKGTKITKNSADRQEQINRARRARAALGDPDKRPAAKTLRQRVIGLGAV